MTFFKNIWFLFLVDLSKLYEAYAEISGDANGRNLKARELNFEVKSKISMKVHRWHRKTEFSDEMVQEAESIQKILNQIYYQAEIEDEKKVFNKPEPIYEPPKPQVMSGLGTTNRS